MADRQVGTLTADTCCPMVRRLSPERVRRGDNLSYVAPMANLSRISTHTVATPLFIRCKHVHFFIHSFVHSVTRPCRADRYNSKSTIQYTHRTLCFHIVKYFALHLFNPRMRKIVSCPDPTHKARTCVGCELHVHSVTIIFSPSAFIGLQLRQLTP